MFGLYALSGKATAFLGPLLVGWGTYLSGNQRIGMGTVIVFFVLGFLLMLTVPPDRTRKAARRPPQAYLAKTDLPADPLTPREREVLQLIAEGKRTKDIAGLLGVSVKTVESHRTRLMEKLDIRQTAGLVRYAIRRGLIQP